jgi:hypothetical protein
MQFTQFWEISRGTVQKFKTILLAQKSILDKFLYKFLPGEIASWSQPPGSPLSYSDRRQGQFPDAQKQPSYE